MDVTAEELLAAARACLRCGREHPQRVVSDHRGQPLRTTYTDHEALPLPPYFAGFMDALITASQPATPPASAKERPATAKRPPRAPRTPPRKAKT